MWKMAAALTEKCGETSATVNSRAFRSVGRRSGQSSFFCFFHDAATTEIYTLSLHDALPISGGAGAGGAGRPVRHRRHRGRRRTQLPDRKSTRLNSSHVKISYAVFCLKK